MLDALFAAVQDAPTSEPPILAAEYTLLCEGEQSTGFAWENGRWVQKVFSTETYLIVKKYENECMDPLGTGMTEEGFIATPVCINRRKVGQRYIRLASVPCIEFYSWLNTRWEVSIQCFNHSLMASFAPNGMFEIAQLSQDTTPNGRQPGRRDSNAVEVGRCSQID